MEPCGNEAGAVQQRSAALASARLGEPASSAIRGSQVARYRAYLAAVYDADVNRYPICEYYLRDNGAEVKDRADTQRSRVVDHIAVF